MHLRKIPNSFREKDPPPLPQRSELSLELDISVMTALYGGGAEPGRNDSFDPFRAPSIRGQLRFWWRASIGGQYASSDELRRAEARVWGSTDGASPVKLRIAGFKSPNEKAAATRGPDGRWNDEPPRYALFPAQEDRKQTGRIYRGGGFRLEVRTPKELADDVDSALWTWLTFGGLGGRTRRGCGALYSKDYANTWNAACMLGDGNARDWPTLRGGTAVIGQRRETWQACWETCLRMYQRFRQDRPHPRARNRWPEPDEIRRIRGVNSPQHAPINTSRGFPRGALGLPIIFHFKTQGDPDHNTLNITDPHDLEMRMASPAILKPMPVSASEAVPLLLVLNTRPMAEHLDAAGLRLVLKQKHSATEEIDPPGRAILHSLARFAAAEWNGQEYRL